MRKKILLMIMVLITTLFVSEQPMSVSAEEQLEIEEEVKESVKAEAKAAGDSIDSATPIVLGSTYRGSIGVNENTDFYKFTINSSGRITISMTAEMERIYYYIYDSTGKELWSDYQLWNSTTGMSSEKKVLDLTRGTYYFSVSSHSSNYTGDYNFNIAFSSAEESFPETGNGTNNSMASANSIGLNTSYNGQIAENDNEDFYKFTINSSGRVTISANAGIDFIYYEIYDSSGKTLWFNQQLWNSSTGMSSKKEVLDLTRGTYYFSVSRPLGGAVGTGNYNFNIAFSSAGESFPETGNGTNNSIPSANFIELDTSYKGQIAKNDDKDFYEFTMSSSKKVQFIANAGMEYIRYYIYDSLGKELWSSAPYWNSNKQSSSINESLTLGKGTYYLGVVQYELYTGNYSFRMSTHSHSYKNIVTKAAPSKNGKIVKKCSCGATNGTTTIYAPKTMALSATKYTYNGKVKKPSVKVKNSKGKVISSSYYKVTYASGRKNAGRYTVKVTFKGNYSGSMSKTFDIVPKSTSLLKVTAAKKAFTVKWKKQSSQTSGYQVQYSTSSKFKTGNKTATISRNKTTSKKISKLKSKKKYYVRVRTYKNVKIGKKTVKLYSGWSKAKSVKTK